MRCFLFEILRVGVLLIVLVTSFTLTWFVALFRFIWFDLDVVVFVWFILVLVLVSADWLPGLILRVGVAICWFGWLVVLVDMFELCVAGYLILAGLVYCLVVWWFGMDVWLGYGLWVC